MERDLPQLSPIDKFLAGDNLPPRIKRNKILAIDRDDAHNFLRITVESNGSLSYKHVSEYFLTENGKPIVVRDIGYASFRLPYPQHSIFGTSGDLEYSIDQETRTTFQQDWDEPPPERGDLEFALRSFPLEKDLLAGVSISYNTIERSGRPSRLWFSYSDGKDYDEYSEVRRHSRHVEYDFLSEKEAKVTTYLGFGDEGLLVQHPFHSIEKDGNTHIFKITSPTIGRQIRVIFPDLIDINEWDNKITVQDRSWRNLGKEMPISLQTIS